MIQAYPPAYVFKAALVRLAGYGQGRRSQHRSFHVFKQRLFQDLGDIDRRRLQDDVRLAGAGLPAFTAPVDPENSVLVFRFHDERELCLQFLRTPGKAEHFVGLLGEDFQLAEDPREGLHHGGVVVTVLLQELVATSEGKPALTLRQQTEKESRPLAETSQRL